jgi:hypothetical protein
MVSDALNHLHFLQSFAEQYAKGLKRSAARPRRRR